MNIKNVKVEKLFFLLSLIFILALSFLVRAYRANWGLPYLYYWDEPQTASNALQMLKTGSLNPHFFGYGTLMIYIHYVVDVFHYLYLMGQPEGLKPFLSNLGEIQTSWNTGWHWTISHPSFYYLNRIVNVVFGTGTVYLTYLITKKIFDNQWAGLIAALFLATANQHVEFSALITPDVPAVFFMLCTVYFSLEFLNTAKTKTLVIALFFTGCAIGVKYNGAIAIVLPITAVIIQYIYNKKSFSIYWIPMLIGIPILTFFLVMPYAFIDLSGFLIALGGEIRHYKVHGHGGNTSEPGLRHIQYQLIAIREYVGTFALAIMFIGVLSIFKKPKLLFVLTLPVIYFLYMTQMRVNFHRNFLIIYPFLGVLFGSATWLINETVIFFISRFSNNSLKPIVHIIPALMAILVFTSGIQTIKDSLYYKNAKDSRSLIVDMLNEVNNTKKVYVASELRFHIDDLKKLKGHEIKELSVLFSCPSAVSDGLVIIPSGIKSMYNSDDDRHKINLLESKLKNINKSKILTQTGIKNNAIFLDIYSMNPEVYVIDGADIEGCQ